MVLSKENSYFKVRVGEHNMDEKEGTEQDIAVENVVLHPKWNIETKNTSNGVKILTTHDIALIQLSCPVKFSSNVQSMCLDDGQPFKAGEKFIKCIISFTPKSDPNKITSQQFSIKVTQKSFQHLDFDGSFITTLYHLMLQS